MILTGGVIARLAAILVGASLLQVTFFSKIGLADTSPDALAAVVIALGILGGAVVGAVCGFAAGLLVDSLLIDTLGATSLALIAAGYLAGRFRESFVFHSPLVPYLLTGFLTALAAAIYAVLQIMVGPEAELSTLIVREVILKGILGVLLSVPLYSLTRRILGPALIDYEPRRRDSLLARFGLARSRRTDRRGIQRTRRVAGLRDAPETPPHDATSAIIGPAPLR